MFEEYNLKVRWKINSKIIYLIRTNYYTVISDVLHARIKRDRKEQLNCKLLKRYVVLVVC